MTKGFTLVEYLLVVSLFAMITVLVVPIGLSLYNAEVLKESASNLRFALRAAHVRALGATFDQDHGVALSESGVVQFVGTAYALRDTAYDLLVVMPDTVSVSGLEEIVFRKYTGTPSEAGTITLGYANATTALTVYDTGYVE